MLQLQMYEFYFVLQLLPSNYIDKGSRLLMLALILCEPEERWL